MDVVLVGLLNVGVFMVLFVPFSQRLLGVRFGLGRMAIGAALTLAVFSPLMNALAGPLPFEGSNGAAVAFLALTALCSMLAGLIFLVLSEALVPTGSLPRVRDLRRDLGGRIARTKRYLQILRIAVRHGLGPYLRGRRRPGRENAAGQADLARSLRLALDEAGVTFVKLGQVLSTRSDVIPASVAQELSRLQDQVSPAPWPEIEAVLTEELGAPPTQVFADFSTEALAAASVAQVYAARLDEVQVVVKVQRPGIASVVERDLDIVQRLARMLERNTDWGRSMGVRALAEGFADAMREELDFTVEAGNMASVAAGRAVTENHDIVVPELYAKFCSRRVLTMQRLDGIGLGTAAASIAERGLDAARLAKVIFECLLGQVAIDGVFHADPHPGNFMLLADGRIGMLDLGSVGRLDPSTREALQRFLLAVDHGDPVAATDALLEIVYRPDVIDEQSLERAVGQFMARHLGAGAALGPAMFNDLFKIITAHELGVPPEVAAVFRGAGDSGRHDLADLPRLRSRCRVAAVRRRPCHRPARTRRTPPYCDRRARHPAPDAAQIATKDRPHRRGRRERQARPERPAVRRRTRSPAHHRPATPDPAGDPRCDRRPDGSPAARYAGRPEGDRVHQPLPTVRVQPAGGLRGPRTPGPGPRLPPARQPIPKCELT